MVIMEIKNIRLDQIVREPVDVSLKEDQVMAQENIHIDDVSFMKVALTYEWNKDCLFVSVTHIEKGKKPKNIYKEMGARPSFNQVVKWVKGFYGVSD
jgi:hypothetical protein